jgi:hypothetical protein
MAFKFLKHKWQKVVLVSFLAFTVLLLLLAFLVNQYWSPILSKKLKAAVAESSDGLYKVDFSEAKLHVLQGKIVIYNIVMKPDTAVYNKRKAQHLAPNNLIELHVKRLVLSQIHPFTLYFKHKLDIGRIVLNSPQVHISYQLNHTTDTVNTDNRTLWQKISKSLKSIHVGDIFLSDVNFKYDDYSGNKLAISEVKEINLQANELLIDSATQTDRSRFLYCKDIVTELNHYKGKTSNGLYTYTINRLKLSTLTSQLNIQGFTLDPVSAGVFFSKTRKDKYTLKLDTIQLNNFDYLSYHKYRSISASSLVLNTGSFDLFNNPNKLKSNKDKLETFPNVALHKLGIDLKLDTVLIKHLDIGYSEHNKKSDKTGTITFNNTHAKLLNITTNKAALQKNNIAIAQINSYFMDRGKLDLTFTFNLTAPNAAYSYKGHLGAMDLQLLNPATRPFAMVKITSGKLKSFDFNIRGNSKVSKGRVIILYNDLKVNLLKADIPNQKLKKKLVETLFANIFILKHNNPDNKGEIPRSFNVTYVRPINSPFFKTAWKTLLTGLKPAVGMDEKTQKATTALMSKKELDKKNRQIKKQLRKQKRAERKLKRQQKKAQKEALKKAEEN